jgi:hypothetical protein
MPFSCCFAGQNPEVPQENPDQHPNPCDKTLVACRQLVEAVDYTDYLCFTAAYQPLILDNCKQSLRIIQIQKELFNFLGTFKNTSPVNHTA